MTFRFPRLAGIIALLLLSVAIVLFIVFINLPTQSPPPTASPTPTSAPITNRFPNTSKTKVKEVLPKEDTSGTTILNPSQVITYSLSQPLTPEQVKVEISPRIPLRVKQGDVPGSITVAPYPPDFWAPDVLYTIVMSDLEGKIITSYNIKVPQVKFQEVVD